MQYGNSCDRHRKRQLPSRIPMIDPNMLNSMQWTISDTQFCFPFNSFTSSMHRIEQYKIPQSSVWVLNILVVLVTYMNSLSVNFTSSFLTKCRMLFNNGKVNSIPFVFMSFIKMYILRTSDTFWHSFGQLMNSILCHLVYANEKKRTDSSWLEST